MTIQLDLIFILGSSVFIGCAFGAGYYFGYDRRVREEKADKLTREIMNE